MRSDDKCESCGRKYNWFEKVFKGEYLKHCAYCGKSFCSQCIKYFGDNYYRFPICQDCLNKGNFVKTWPSTYLGKIPIDYNFKTLPISSDYYKNKDLSLWELRISAGVKGFDGIYNVTYIRYVESEETESGGVYKYSVWKATGVAFRLRKK